MVKAKTPWKLKGKEVSKRSSKKETVSEVVTEKKISNDSNVGVSVFTKTTTPKVVIQSEKMDNTGIYQNVCKHRIIKSACLIIMGIIILMTFFLALKTYNSVNELSDYVHLVAQP
jgi:hypothetical protein